MFDEKTVAELKDKHGSDLIEVEFADQSSFVFRKPSRQAYNRWFDKRAEGPTQAGLELAQACVVHPGYAELVAALDKQPAMLMCGGGVVDGITDLAGVPSEAKKAKKL